MIKILILCVRYRPLAVSTILKGNLQLSKKIELNNAVLVITQSHLFVRQVTATSI